MKLLLSLLALCTLSATAGALTCLQCTSSSNPTCLLPSTETCTGSETACINAFVTDQDGNERIFRRCAGPGLCPDLGQTLVEASVGAVAVAAFRECCDSDNCNGGNLTFPDPPQPNGKTCPGTTPPDATFTDVVQCRGNQDTCFLGQAIRNGALVTIGGCGSSDVCDSANELEQVPFIEGAVRVDVVCTAITTTTTTTTTTTPPTTTSTTPPTTEPPTFGMPPPTDVPPATDMPKDPKAFLAKFKFLVVKLKLLSAAIKLQLAQLLQQHQLVLFQLHLQLLDYQQQLLSQQEGLPIDHYHQLPLYYQQCLLVSHHQLLLHQLHLSLSGQQHLLQLLYYQQVYVHQLQQLLHYHHGHILPHYYGYLMHYYYNQAPQPVSATTPEEPTTEAPTPGKPTPEEPTTTTPVVGEG
ncbi:uncharacterized protein LOC115385598 [Salarias fasciatus]|uniref:uncharacterized protein LOC115385598 n=1 Tax=Salarias fasciatus TaxID=181472 RepID=UPI0011764D84|nr:uncharacterized protein LOC115385598 [Salarias fasciatus]